MRLWPSVTLTGDKGQKRIALRPLYSCRDMCDRAGASPGLHRLRAAARCSLPDFDPAAWDPSADKSAAGDAEGRAEELHACARAQGLTLDFELERDGCPMGWALSRYALSVISYLEPRDVSSSARAQNLRLLRRVLRDEIEPVELIAAVELLRRWEDTAFAQFHELVARG